MPAEMSKALGGGSDALFDVITRRAGSLLGDALFTVLVPNDRGTRLVRIYSSNKTDYPLGEADKVDDTAWFRQLFISKQPVVANNGAEIAGWLPDFADQSPMHYESLANLPIIAGGQVLGIMNLMSTRDRFTEETMHFLRAETPMVALAILVSARQRTTRALET
jgi:GAF domain-containing protein